MLDSTAEGGRTPFAEPNRHFFHLEAGPSSIEDGEDCDGAQLIDAIAPVDLQQHGHEAFSKLLRPGPRFFDELEEAE